MRCRMGRAAAHNLAPGLASRRGSICSELEKSVGVAESVMKASARDAATDADADADVGAQDGDTRRYSDTMERRREDALLAPQNATTRWERLRQLGTSR